MKKNEFVLGQHPAHSSTAVRVASFLETSCALPSALCTADRAYSSAVACVRAASSNPSSAYVTEVATTTNLQFCLENKKRTTTDLLAMRLRMRLVDLLFDSDLLVINYLDLQSLGCLEIGLNSQLRTNFWNLCCSYGIDWRSIIRNHRLSSKHLEWLSRRGCRIHSIRFASDISDRDVRK